MQPIMNAVRHSVEGDEEGLEEDLKQLSDVMKNMKTALARMHGASKKRNNFQMPCFYSC